MVVEGPGDLVWRYPAELTERGSFYHAFREDELPTGTFSAHLEDEEKNRFGHVTFRVEAYRLPRFEVQLHTPRQVPLDREFSVGEQHAG